MARFIFMKETAHGRAKASVRTAPKMLKSPVNCAHTVSPLPYTKVPPSPIPETDKVGKSGAKEAIDFTVKKAYVIPFSF